jgi:radical SAM superfamily enzyme YgiQ (UPF0313 family)
VAIGIETWEEGLRRRILSKQLDNETIRRAARLIRDHGMRLVTFNMLAAPEETIEQGLQTMKFNAEIGAYHARVGICFPSPDTEMSRQALAEGLCVEGYGRSMYERQDNGMGVKQVFFRSAKPDESRFINLLELFNLGVSYPALIPLIERAIHLPHNPLFSMIGKLSLLREKALFRFSLLQGLDYFRHVGSPYNRTTNFVGLV